MCRYQEFKTAVQKIEELSDYIAKEISAKVNEKFTDKILDEYVDDYIVEQLVEGGYYGLFEKIAGDVAIIDCKINDILMSEYNFQVM